MKLGEALVKDSLITRDQLRTALERQVIFGGRLGTNCVELGIIKEKELLAFLGRHFRVPAVKPADMAAIDAGIIGCIGKDLAEKYKIVPFRKDRNRLHVAMLDPRVMASVDALRFITGYDVVPYAVTELRLLHALEKYYGTERDLRYISTFGASEGEDKPAEDKKKEQMQKVREAFADARDREEIVALLLNESKKIVSRAAIFLLRGDRLIGWKARGLSIEGRQVSLSPHSPFADVIAGKEFYRGPLLKIPENQALEEILAGTPNDCLAVPVRIREKIIGLLYVDNGNSAVLDGALNYVKAFAMMASLSLEIAVLRRKILES